MKIFLLALLFIFGNAYADQLDQIESNRLELIKKLVVLKNKQLLLNEQITKQNQIIKNHDSICNETFNDEKFTSECNESANKIDKDSNTLNIKDRKNHNDTLLLVTEIIKNQSETIKIYKNMNCR